MFQIPDSVEYQALREYSHAECFIPWNVSYCKRTVTFWSLKKWNQNFLKNRFLVFIAMKPSLLMVIGSCIPKCFMIYVVYELFSGNQKISLWPLLSIWAVSPPGFSLSMSSANTKFSLKICQSDQWFHQFMPSFQSPVKSVQGQNLSINIRLKKLSFQIRLGMEISTYLSAENYTRENLKLKQSTFIFTISCIYYLTKLSYDPNEVRRVRAWELASGTWCWYGEVHFAYSRGVQAQV